MRTTVLHVGRRWHLVNNHLDARHCPLCGATVHGNQGQRSHQRYHEHQEEIMNRFTEIIRMLSGQMADARTETLWTAAVDGDHTDREALNG